MMESLFLEPVDVLYLRGNRLFEGAGAHGEALMPPWPSVAAGAIRSRMLAGARADLEAFAEGGRVADPRFDAALGTPAEPGAFRIAAFTLAREMDGRIDPCLPLPADVVVSDAEGLTDAVYLQPQALPIATSAGLPQVPVLRTAAPVKPVSGLWLTAAGWRAWLAGEPLERKCVLHSRDLWKTDPRLGIALDKERRTAADGQLYTAETVALGRGVGFLVAVTGADGLLPDAGLLRLGGDGRGAEVHSVSADWPQPDDALWSRIEQEGRFRLLLTTPGLFPEGWRLPGVADDGVWRGPDGLQARLVAAAVPRAGVVSGWDLALRRPKAAARVVPAGSVYWFEAMTGEASGLRKLAEDGLWACIPENARDATRRAEGFNNVQIAAWPRD
jgi:CRISPR-associated protein Cmr3